MKGKKTKPPTNSKGGGGGTSSPRRGEGEENAQLPQAKLRAEFPKEQKRQEPLVWERVHPFGKKKQGHRGGVPRPRKIKNGREPKAQKDRNKSFSGVDQVLQ